MSSVANNIYLISDGENVSRSELLRKISKSFSNNLILLPSPISILDFFSRLLGKSHLSRRLFSNLQLDSSKSTELLDWEPVVTMDEQLRKMAEFEKGAARL